jgi:hypothetical protein
MNRRVNSIFPIIIGTLTLFLGAGKSNASILIVTKPNPNSGIVTNPISQFPIVIDGKLTDGVVNGQIQGEWSDIKPLAFISPSDQNGTLLRTFVGDPKANSLLYAGIANEADGSPPSGLYLLYDYLPRTNSNFAPGEFLADVQFPVTFGGKVQDITVQFRGATNNLVDILVRLANGNIVPAAELGLEGAVGFGPSALSSTPHLLAELEVPLLIPPGFNDEIFGQGGQGGHNGGGYSPDPAFWGSNFANDKIDPPASSALFQINSNGSTTANSSSVASANVPEPSSTIGLLALGTLGIASTLKRKLKPSQSTAKQTTKVG